MDWDNSLFILLTIRDILEINYYIKIGQKTDREFVHYFEKFTY